MSDISPSLSGFAGSASFSAAAGLAPPPPPPDAGAAAAAAFIAPSYSKSYSAAIPTEARFLKAFIMRCGAADGTMYPEPRERAVRF